MIGVFPNLIYARWVTEKQEGVHLLAVEVNSAYFALRRICAAARAPSAGIDDLCGTTFIGVGCETPWKRYN